MQSRAFSEQRKDVSASVSAAAWSRGGFPPPTEGIAPAANPIAYGSAGAAAECYFAALEAPKGKQLIWFENSGPGRTLRSRSGSSTVIEAAGAALP